MKTKDANMVWAYVDNEGFDYCFCSYSDFEEVKDKKFHKLREAYIKAKDDLEEYLLKHVDEEAEDEE